ncbi:MAG: hypothetical protein ACYC7A_06590 [Thermoanaerobaculia bacterium]
MNRKSILLTSALVAAIATSAFAGQKVTAFSMTMRAYENIRLSLAANSIDGVAKRAAGIARIADSTAKDYKAADAGIAPKHEAAGPAALAKVASAATALSRTSDIAVARAVFADLSIAMIELRSLAEGDKGRVATCPMLKQSWIQPDGKISNPYDATMPACGEFVE